ncbi:MAG: nitrilase-related carbon-nitrogen hydrolase [Gemmatimonadaceae bacterium]
MRIGTEGSGWSAAVAVLLSATAYYLGTGLHPWWPLVWVAPLPLLLLPAGMSRWRGLTLSFVAYLAGSLNIVTYLGRLLPIPAILIALVAPAAIFALTLEAHRSAMRRDHALAMLAFPAAWTSYEFILARFSPDGTALNLAYTQVSNLPVVQLASVTGLWGISFLVTLLPAGVAAAWSWRRRAGRSVLAVGLPLCALALVVGYGWSRLRAPITTPSVRVGAAVSDTSVHLFKTAAREQAMPVVAAYAARVDALAKAGAQVAVLPEKFVGVAPGYEADAFEVMRAAAVRNRVFVVGSFNLVDRAPLRNLAFVFAPDGSQRVAYDKANLLPSFEQGYQRGRAPGVFALGDAPAGVAICKDMDFPGWLRGYAAAGTRILFVPAWDFVIDGPLHARMAVMRGVEGGYAVVRAAQEGLLLVTDDRGRVHGERASSSAGELQLTTEVPLGAGGTFYSRTGDWFGVLSLLILVASLATGRRPKQR